MKNQIAGYTRVSDQKFKLKKGIKIKGGKIK